MQVCLCGSRLAWVGNLTCRLSELGALEDAWPNSFPHFRHGTQAWSPAFRYIKIAGFPLVAMVFGGDRFFFLGDWLVDRLIGFPSDAMVVGRDRFFFLGDWLVDRLIGFPLDAVMTDGSCSVSLALSRWLCTCQLLLKVFISNHYWLCAVVSANMKSQNRICTHQYSQCGFRLSSIPCDMTHGRAVKSVFGLPRNPRPQLWRGR